MSSKLFLCAATVLIAGQSHGEQPETIVVGIPDTLFHGVASSVRQAGTKPLLKIIKDGARINSDVAFAPGPAEIAKDLHEGKFHLGVFQGHEFAWAQAKYPDLVPIAVASPKVPHQAFCVVRWDSNAKSIGELNGQKIAFPQVRRDFCDLFLAKQKAEHMKEKGFEGELHSDTAVDAIFDVIEGKAGCAIIDCNALTFFRDVYPGQSRNIKVLCESDVFPSTCVAMKKESLDGATIERVCRALLTAKDLTGGAAMLESWKLNGFIKVPDGYDKTLSDMRKAYPGPLAQKP